MAKTHALRQDGPVAQLPDIRLELIDEQSFGEPGFLRLVRRKLQAVFPDGSRSAQFEYDEVDRSALDAVVLVAHYLQAGQRFVFLRSSLRPPLAFRRGSLPPVAAAACLWELPAGLVEADEESQLGLLRCAQREIREELGFSVGAEQLRELGRGTFPSPGVLAERHYFFEFEVQPEGRQEPDLDGSVLEQGGRVIAVELQRALQWCSSGHIEDAKTELGLRRLAAAVGGAGP
jgi:ADP-ribose pyrophosphatase